MDWLDEIELELRRGHEAEKSGNAGRARTAARRAVGMAVTAYQKHFPGKRYGNDFMKQIRGIAEDQVLPVEVREAATRLQARISQEFTSLSRQPLVDATVIINFIRQALTS